MTLEIFLRYIHFISIFIIAGSLITEWVLLKKELTRQELGKLSIVDAFYGAASVALLSAGLTLWLAGIGKPVEFYNKNFIFLIKIALFACVGILSIYPTVFFIKSRKGKQDDVVILPKAIFWILRIELMLLMIIPFLAGLMAKGIGYSE